MSKRLLSAFFIIAALAVSALIVSAQDTDSQPPVPCSDYDKEVLRVPKAASTKDENGDTVYQIMGNESWRRTDLEVKRGQTIEISADGVVRWAPDGIEKIDVTPDGTRPPYRDGWNYYHFPYPEAGMGSLVMRIGKGIYPIGAHRTLEAEDNGFIEFMVNDDKLDDNSGYFSVRATVTDRTSLDPRTTAKKN